MALNSVPHSIFALFYDLLAAEVRNNYLKPSKLNQNTCNKLCYTEPPGIPLFSGIDLVKYFIKLLIGKILKSFSIIFQIQFFSSFFKNLILML